MVEYIDDNQYQLIDYGVIERNGMDMGETLLQFEERLQHIIAQYHPHGISAEAPFVGSNKQVVQKLSMFHGIMQLIAKKMHLPVAYYAVMTLKSKVLGGIKTKNEDGSKKTGTQMKKEVANKIFDILGKENFIKEFNDDVTDSISACITYCIMKGEMIEKRKGKK